MMRRNCILLIAALSLAATNFSRTAGGCEEIFNPDGWDLPKNELFRLSWIKKISLPGVPYEIAAEHWLPKEDSQNRSTDLPLYQQDEKSPIGPIKSDNVRSFTVYKTSDGRIICYLYHRVLRYANPEIIDYVVGSYVCDLDGDGSYESQFPVGMDSENDELLASIARIKLGRSEEGWLVNRMVRSIKCQLREGR